jgi:hypothetical protein
MSAATDAVTALLAHDPDRAKALGLVPPAPESDAAVAAAAKAATEADANALAAFVAYSSMKNPFSRARMRFEAGSELIEHGRELARAVPK